MNHYQQIKTFILDGIDEGDWKSGAKIPSENELAEQFAVSRMTVNRAIKELEADGVVDRVQGKGTFVSTRPLKSVLQIQAIDREIQQRGGMYSCQVIHVREEKSDSEISNQLGLVVGSKVYTSLILHCEDGQPVQLEQRWVRPSEFRKYLKQDFQKQSPHDYLMSQSPFTNGEHVIEACLPDAHVRRVLKMASKEPCLLIHRRTWVGKTIASYVKLFHPGSRFQLTTTMTR